MSMLTIPNLDAVVLERLRAEAQRQGKSASDLAAELIEHAVAPSTSTVSTVAANRRSHRDVSRLAGTWTKEQADEFDRAVASFGQVDEDLWK